MTNDYLQISQQMNESKDVNKLFKCMSDELQCGYNQSSVRKMTRISTVTSALVSSAKSPQMRCGLKTTDEKIRI